MTFYPIKNNISTTIASVHSPGDGIIRVATGAGSSFGNSFPIRVTCQRVSDNAITIFSVSMISGDSLGVTAIEGTTDVSFAVGDICEMRLTAGAVEDIENALLYTTTSPTTSTVGGVSSGTTFTNVLLGDVIDQLLHVYLTPAFTSFSITGATTQEVGATFSGSKTFTWATSNSGNVTANSIDIADVTGSTTLGSSLTNDGSQAFSINVAHNSPTTNVWSITGQNTQSNSFSDTTSVNWRWKLYYGTSVSVTLNESAIEALTSNTLTSSFTNTYVYASGGYKYLSFPDAFGGTSVFKDALTQLNVAMADSSDNAAYSNTESGFSYALVSVTNAFSITTNYRVYRTKNILGGSINIIVS